MQAGIAPVRLPPEGALVSFVESSGDEGGVLTTYESFDELRDNAEDVAENVVSAVAAALGVDHFEDLDI